MTFFRSERGGLLPFTLIITGTVILMGALAVNTVRVEHSRSISQSVLDICVLNAAAQRQTLEPRTVFDDCLAKHGFEGAITDFQATTGQTKSVTATAEIEVESFFLQDPVTFDIGVGSTAQETLSNLEIVLALDVSASLATTGPDGTVPIDNLKAAANLFVDRILAEDTAGKIKITLLPYNSNVNLGADLAARFNVINAPVNMMQNTTRIGPDVTQMRCLDLPSDSFAATGISPTTPILAMPFLDMVAARPGRMPIPRPPLPPPRRHGCRKTCAASTLMRHRLPPTTWSFPRNTAPPPLARHSSASPHFRPASPTCAQPPTHRSISGCAGRWPFSTPRCRRSMPLCARTTACRQARWIIRAPSTIRRRSR